jgi:hypothetical protein
MGSMAGIAERAVDQRDIILILGQDGDRDAMATVQIAILAAVR